MSGIAVACQTYTWEMLGEAWEGQVTDLLDAIAAAGYEGLEITNSMIGVFAERPEDFAGELAARGLRLAAFAYAQPSGFTDPHRRAADLAGAQQAIDFVRRFPEPRLGLGGAAHPSRDGARDKLDIALDFYHEVGRLAIPYGISVNIHPHSHYGSLLETAEEYEYLLNGLDPRYVSFGPDTGHIVRGGQELLPCLRSHLPRITHLHLKDTTAEGKWVPFGEGVCDIPAVLALLVAAGYEGWVVGEEESEAARGDGAAAVRRNREYLNSLGY